MDNDLHDALVLAVLRSHPDEYRTAFEVEQSLKVSLEDISSAIVRLGVSAKIELSIDSGTPWDTAGRFTHNSESAESEDSNARRLRRLRDFARTIIVNRHLLHSKDIFDQAVRCGLLRSKPAEWVLTDLVTGGDDE